MARASATLCTCIVLLAARSALGDLGASVRRSAARGTSTAVLPSGAPLTGPVVVHLKRAGARHSKSEATFYVGQVSVGHPPQSLDVTFDTSSGDVLLPHRACRNTSCMEHHRYSPWESTTAMDINADGGLVEGMRRGQRLARGAHRRDLITVDFTQSDLGEGEIKAVVVRDTVCAGAGGQSGTACVDMALLAAVNMDDKPFRAMPSDGIIGLGFGALASGPMSSFVGRLLEGSRDVVPQFGIAFDAGRGELHLGGHDSARLAAPLRWFPVDHPEQGYWQVAIQAVRVGNKTVDECLHGCHGVVDTGVSRLGVQASRMPVMRHALASALADHIGCQGPDLTFDLGGMVLTLQARDYAGSDCSPLLGSLDLEEPKFVGVYAFGETLLRRYYAAFDWEEHKLGFAPLVRDIAPVAEKSQALPDALAGTVYVF